MSSDCAAILSLCLSVSVNIPSRGFVCLFDLPLDKHDQGCQHFLKKNVDVHVLEYDTIMYNIVRIIHSCPGMPKL